MTATITTEYTRDELTNPDRRCIRTRWTTSLTKIDKYEGESTILLVLETSHNKGRKVIEADLYTEVQKDGYSVREFTLRESSGGSGIRVTREPVARFNAKTAREIHAWALNYLESTPITRDDRAGTDLAAAWDARI